MNLFMELGKELPIVSESNTMKLFMTIRRVIVLKSNRIKLFRFLSGDCGLCCVCVTSFNR